MDSILVVVHLPPTLIDDYSGVKLPHSHHCSTARALVFSTNISISWNNTARKKVRHDKIWCSNCCMLLLVFMAHHRTAKLDVLFRSFQVDQRRISDVHPSSLIFISHSCCVTLIKKGLFNNYKHFRLVFIFINHCSCLFMYSRVVLVRGCWRKQQKKKMKNFCLLHQLPTVIRMTNNNGNNKTKMKKLCG